MAKTERPAETEAITILEKLRTHLCPELALALNKDIVADVLDVPPTHKSHPLASILRSVGNSFDPHVSQVLANQEMSLRSTILDRTGEAKKWAIDHLNAAGLETNIENAAAKLAELRAFGSLWSAGFRVKPIPPTRGPTRDFDATIDGHIVGIEVHCKQLNSEQSRQLKAFNEKRGGEHAVYPAGQPRRGETIAENVASKFASIKPKAKQASLSTPTILWLDLQDSDWWVIDASYTHPVVVSQKVFYSGGLWQAMYGKKGTHLYEGHSTVSAYKQEIPVMKHDGLFRQSPEWIGVVLAFPRETVFFENPAISSRISNSVREAICQLPRYDFGSSRMNWPPYSWALYHALYLDRVILKKLASRAKYGW